MGFWVAMVRKQKPNNKTQKKATLNLAARRNREGDRTARTGSNRRNKEERKHEHKDRWTKKKIRRPALVAGYFSG